MKELNLNVLENEASKAGFLLRMQVRRPLNIWTIKVVVAVVENPDKVKLLGEVKGWAYQAVNGFQIDTIRVDKKAPSGVGHLLWAATMAWALESTPCRKARLLAIRDGEYKHMQLERYFSKRGFKKIRDVGSAPIDLPLRVIWGGAGSLMIGECRDIYESSLRLWHIAAQLKNHN